MKIGEKYDRLSVKPKDFQQWLAGATVLRFNSTSDNMQREVSDP